MTNLEAEISELQNLDKERTQGEWRVCSDLPSYAIASNNYRVVQTPNQNNYRAFDRTDPWHRIERAEDAEFIAKAPRMMHIILEQREEMERLRGGGKLSVEQVREEIYWPILEALEMLARGYEVDAGVVAEKVMTKIRNILTAQVEAEK